MTRVWNRMVSIRICDLWIPWSSRMGGGHCTYSTTPTGLREWHRLQNCNNGGTTTSHSWSSEVWSSASGLWDKPSLFALHHSNSISIISWWRYIVWDEKKKARASTLMDSSEFLPTTPYMHGMGKACSSERPSPSCGIKVYFDSQMFVSSRFV